MKYITKKLILTVVVLLAIATVPVLASEWTGALNTGASTGPDGTVIVAPTATPVAGTYTSAQSVVLVANGSSSINYTTDGTVPACSTGNVYSSAISVSSSEAIKAIACYPNNYSSSVADFEYTINSTDGGGSGTTYYTISVSSGAGGSISPTPASLISGSSQTYSILPSSGYQIADVMVDGTSVGTVATYTFSSIASNHTISATFSAIVVTSTSGGGGGGGGAVPVNFKTGDINKDGNIDEYDFAILMSQWSQTGISLSADINHDGVVDEYDFAILMANWGL